MRRERFEEFIEEYGKIKIPFWCETRVETVKPGYAEKMEKVGCTSVSRGVESGSISLRKSLLGRLMPDSEIIRGFKEFEKTNIRISANNIIGFPGETREDLMLTIDLNRKLNPDSVVVNAFQPYSGTKLRKICIEKGLIPKEERAEDYRIYGSFYNGAISAQELENIRKCFSLYITFPKSRWPEIRKAETDDRIFNALMKEYKDKEMLNRKNRESIPNSIHGNIEANEVFINDQESVVV